MVGPKNIIVIVVDSLRYDSSLGCADQCLPYASAHSTRFTQARSNGCWTLPATASMFTGLLPHEHGATTQTRSIRKDVKTVAQHMQDAGYRTIQITANAATTELFGMDRGFDETHKVYLEAPMRHRLTDQILWLLARPVICRKLFSETRDFVTGRLASDLKGARAWMQSNAQFQFERVHRTLHDLDKKNQRGFIYVNLMECHFPYHLDETFSLSREGMVWSLREIRALFHFVNQTRLVKDREFLTPEWRQILHRRQVRAWQRLALQLDEFIRQLHEDTGNLVLLCSDHGDNFGEQDWEYHFSNVNEAGNRTPLFILEPNQKQASVVRRPIAGLSLYGTLLSFINKRNGHHSLTVWENSERAIPMLESFWYNKANRTLERYRFNQFAFVLNDRKYVLRDSSWLQGRLQHEDEPEPPLLELPTGASPIHDLRMPGDLRRLLASKAIAYAHFVNQNGVGNVDMTQLACRAA